MVNSVFKNANNMDSGDEFHFLKNMLKYIKDRMGYFIKNLIILLS